MTADIRPNHTIYINNLNEKIKKEGNMISARNNVYSVIFSFIYIFLHLLHFFKYIYIVYSINLSCLTLAYCNNHNKSWGYYLKKRMNRLKYHRFKSISNIAYRKMNRRWIYLVFYVFD